jgi:hypothetical protein
MLYQKGIKRGSVTLQKGLNFFRFARRRERA